MLGQEGSTSRCPEGPAVWAGGALSHQEWLPRHWGLERKHPAPAGGLQWVVLGVTLPSTLARGRASGLPGLSVPPLQILRWVSGARRPLGSASLQGLNCFLGLVGGKPVQLSLGRGGHSGPVHPTG